MKRAPMFQGFSYSKSKGIREFSDQFSVDNDWEQIVISLFVRLSEKFQRLGSSGFSAVQKL